MYEIRDIERRDALVCFKIAEQHWGTETALATRLEILDGFNNPSNWPPFYIVATYGNQVIGFAGFRRVLLAPDTWEHTWANVRKDHQGKGVGQLLAQGRFERIKAYGGKLVLTASKTPAWPAKNGFQPLYEFEGWHIMIKRL